MKQGKAGADRRGRAARRMKFESLEPRWLLAGDLVMYNDHLAGAATHPFTTSYATVEVTSGLLRDSVTGGDTAVTLTTSDRGAAYDNVVGSPAAGTDAHDLFHDWVDFGSGGGASIVVSGSSTGYTHSFSGLNPDTIYDFAGTAVRGRDGYANRWTLVTLVGAESFLPAHSAGVGVVTAGLAANQVAIWTGENHLASQGFVAAWEEIDPGADGQFEVVSQQYLGPTPGVGDGSAATGSKGYALTAVRLVERELNVLRVVATDPALGAALTSAPSSYRVDFNLPVDASTVDAGDLTVDGTPATAVQVIDADTLEFTLPPLGAGPEHQVAIAAGAVGSEVDALPSEPFATTFAVLSGSGVAINEVSYDPGDGSLPLEFVELFNAGPTAVDLSGWSLDDAVSFTLPGGTVLGSGEYLIVSQNPAEFFNFYGLASVGPFAGKLSNDGETVALLDDQGATRDEVDYRLGFPWPTIGDIPGESIQLINPTFENDLGGNWRSAAATPGAVNSVFAVNAPPQMRRVSHEPTAPAPGQDVTITMRITDPQGVGSVLLEYQLVDPGDYIEINDPRYATDWTSVVMRDDGLAGDDEAGDNTYTAVLPGGLQTHRRLVRYRVTAEDGLGAAVTAPHADDPQPNFAYFVYGQTPDYVASAQPGVEPAVAYDGELLNSVATYHLITTRQDHVDAQYLPGTTRSSGYTGSEYLWEGALVYNGEVYDHIRYRARGGVWRYSMGKNMWKFKFNRGHDFQALDNYGEQYENDWRRLNLSAVIQQGDSGARGEQGLFESAGFKLYNLAGQPASNTQYVSFRIIEDANETGGDQYANDFQGLYLAVEQVDGRFLDEHGLADGNLYKMERDTGVDGIGGELKNQGDYPEPNDSSDLIEFKTAYEIAAQPAAWWKENVDLEAYYTYHAVSHVIRQYDTHAGKNFYFHHDPDTDLWRILPWDLDRTWWYPEDGVRDPLTNPILDIPEFRQGFENRLREILDLLYNPDQAGAVIDEVASFVYTPGEASLVDADRARWDYNPLFTSDYVRSSKSDVGLYYTGGGVNISQAAGSYAGMIDYMKQFIVDKSDWLIASVLTNNSQIPATPVISYQGEAGFAADRLAFGVDAFSDPNGDGFGAMEWRIGEISNPSTPLHDPNQPWVYEIDAVWESGELGAYANSIEVGTVGLQQGHTYRARVRVQDDAGNWSHWSDALEFVAGAEVIPPLRITELHYHPNNDLADESDQEFIEIMNTGASPVSLAGLQIADFASTPYVFPAGATLGAGQMLVVPRNVAAFQSIYGTDIAIAAEGYGGRNLSNGGETVTLRTAGGEVIHSVTYDDNQPWPALADGDGPSLEVIDPLGDPDDPANWQASLTPGGTPGRGSSIVGDYDRDGVVGPEDRDLWRSTYGSVADLRADGNQDGRVDAADYAVWRDHLGDTAFAVVTTPAASSVAAPVTSAPLVDARESSEPPAAAFAWSLASVAPAAPAAGTPEALRATASQPAPIEPNLPDPKLLLALESLPPPDGFWDAIESPGRDDHSQEEQVSPATLDLAFGVLSE